MARFAETFEPSHLLQRHEITARPQADLCGSEYLVVAFELDVGLVRTTRELRSPTIRCYDKLMLKYSLGRPIQRWGSLFAFFATTALGVTASAFPVTNGQEATELLGWDTFDRGFADMAIDPFFGADVPAANRFFVPVDIDFDTAGERAFVADLHNHRILIFDVSGGFTTDMGAAFVLGQPDFATGAAVDTNPYQYNNNTPNLVFGCQEGVSACGMSRAFAVAYDAGNDRLFASDFDNNRILVWDISALTNGMPATWVIGQQDLVSGAVNAPCATGTDLACGLNGPTELALDADTQTLFVADSENHRVLTFDVSQLVGAGLGSGLPASNVIGQPTINDIAANGCGTVGIVNDCGFDTPQSIALDPNGNRLFIGDSRNSRALVFDTTLGINTGMSAALVVGQPDFFTATPNTSCDGLTSGDENVNRCGLAIPFEILAINVDYNELDDDLYISDSANSRVLVFDAANLDTNVEATAVLGQELFTDGYSNLGPNFGGSTSRSSLFLPLGVDYDPSSDRIFVSDGGNHRILSFGANVGGTPVDVNGDIDTIDTTDNGDSTTVTVVSDLGDTFSVTFPNGTGPEAGADSIGVSVTTVVRSNGRTIPTIRIDAELPPGETKTISVSRGTRDTICIFDHAERAQLRAGGRNCRGGEGVRHEHPLPALGTCNNGVIVHGDPADGDHPVNICLDNDPLYGEMIRVEGLLHTTIALPPAGDDVAQHGAVQDENSLDAPGNEDSNAGCNASTRSSSTGFGLLLMAAIALGLRRRQRVSVRATRERSTRGR